MAPHSSSLAWKIPWMEEPGGLQSMGSLSQTRLSEFTFTFHSHALEKEMATHSSVLAWRNPRDGGAWWAAVCGVTQSWTRLKRLSSSSSSCLAWDAETGGVVVQLVRLRTISFSPGRQKLSLESSGLGCRAWGPGAFQMLNLRMLVPEYPWGGLSQGSPTPRGGVPE